MKKILFLLIFGILIIVNTSCNDRVKLPNEYYSTDSESFRDLDKIKKHEDHLKEMRVLTMENNKLTNKSTDYDNKIRKIKYNILYKSIDSQRELINDINNNVSHSFSIADIDTIKCNNGAFIFSPKIEIDKNLFNSVINIRNRYNKSLYSLDSLDRTIGL